MDSQAIAPSPSGPSAAEVVSVGVDVPDDDDKSAPSSSLVAFALPFLLPFILGRAPLAPPPPPLPMRAAGTMELSPSRSVALLRSASESDWSATGRDASERRALLPLPDAAEEQGALIKTPLPSSTSPRWDMGIRDRGRVADGGVDRGMKAVEEAVVTAGDLGLGLGAGLESAVAGLSSRSAVRGRLRGGSDVSRGVCKRDDRELRPRISEIGRRGAE